MWLNFNVNKKLILNNCSYGKGVFAGEDIDAGEEILQFGGPIVGVKELPRPYTAKNDYYLQIGTSTFLGPSGQLDDYVNHSCSANTGVVFDAGVIKLIAILFVPAGNQITFDYSTTMDSFWWEMECACGSKNCRRKVENFVDLSEQIQYKYIKMGVVPEYILKKLTCIPLRTPGHGDFL
ncbi:SET domain-containing protein [Thermodesulfobacteriota bacterium]